MKIVFQCVFSVRCISEVPGYVRQILTPTVAKAVLQDEHKIAPKIFDGESLALAVKNSPASLES